MWILDPIGSRAQIGTSRTNRLVPLFPLTLSLPQHSACDGCSQGNKQIDGFSTNHISSDKLKKNSSSFRRFQANQP
jgi:hypothetical protein